MIAERYFRYDPTQGIQNYSDFQMVQVPACERGCESRSIHPARETECHCQKILLHNKLTAYPKLIHVLPDRNSELPSEDGGRPSTVNLGEVSAAILFPGDILFLHFCMGAAVQ
jgi:hypothetical protein